MGAALRFDLLMIVYLLVAHIDLVFIFLCMRYYPTCIIILLGVWMCLQPQLGSKDIQQLISVFIFSSSSIIIFGHDIPTCGNACYIVQLCMFILSFTSIDISAVSGVEAGGLIVDIIYIEDELGREFRPWRYIYIYMYVCIWLIC